MIGSAAEAAYPVKSEAICVRDTKGSRRQLLQTGLIAYQKPLCQVLSLDPIEEETRSGQGSVGDILRKALGGQP